MDLYYFLNAQFSKHRMLQRIKMIIKNQISRSIIGSLLKDLTEMLNSSD